MGISRITIEVVRNISAILYEKSRYLAVTVSVQDPDADEDVLLAEFQPMTKDFGLTTDSESLLVASQQDQEP